LRWRRERWFCWKCPPRWPAAETLITTREGIKGRFAEVDATQGFFWAVQLDYTRFNPTANLTRTSAQAQAMSLGAPEQVIAGRRWPIP